MGVDLPASSTMAKAIKVKSSTFLNFLKGLHGGLGFRVLGLGFRVAT